MFYESLKKIKVDNRVLLKILCFLVICILLSSCSSFNKIQKQENEYWKARYKNANGALMTPKQIEKFNKKVFLHNKDLIDFNNLPNKIKRNKEKRYALIIQKSNMRVRPTNKPLFENKKDKHFDQMQVKELKVGEPVIVLRGVKNWDLVLSSNAGGWVENKNIAFFVSYKDFKKYINNKKFIVVTKKQTVIKEKILDMGVKLPLIREKEDTYEIKLPFKDKKEKLVFKKANIKKGNAHVGYLPFTAKNLVKQALKYQGTNYGWGGLENGVDCSGMLVNIYATFGFFFPRNSSTQQNMTGNAIAVSNRDEVEKILSSKMVGSLLYFPGHIMLYLGKRGGENYIIHSLAVYLNEGKKDYIMLVLISGLDIIRKTGNPFKDEITSITEIKKVR